MSKNVFDYRFMFVCHLQQPTPPPPHTFTPKNNRTLSAFVLSGLYHSKMMLKRYSCTRCHKMKNIYVISQKKNVKKPQKYSFQKVRTLDFLYFTLSAYGITFHFALTGFSPIPFHCCIAKGAAVFYYNGRRVPTFVKKKNSIKFYKNIQYSLY